MRLSFNVRREVLLLYPMSEDFRRRHRFRHGYLWRPSRRSCKRIRVVRGVGGEFHTEGVLKQVCGNADICYDSVEDLA